jgi:integrase
MNPSHSPATFAAFQNHVLAIYSSGRHARKTYLRVRQVLRELAGLGLTTPAELTTAALARWMASKGPEANQNTLNGLLGSASAVCSVAIEEGWLTRRPNFRRLRLRGSPTRVNLPRGYEELTRLLGELLARRGAWQGHRLCALAWTIALTGARLGEVVSALPADLDLVGRTLTIEPRPGRRLKTESSARRVPLPAVLVEVLRPWVDLIDSPWLFPGVKRRGPWTGGSYGARALDQLQAAARSVGIPHITWHSLRHAYGTYSLERWDVPIWIVQRVMGHRDIRTTQRYLHLDDSPVIQLATRDIGYHDREASA